MRAVSYICVLLFGGIGTYLLFSLGVFPLPSDTANAGGEPAFNLPIYLDFLAVLLTVVTVVLTAVAIGIGVVAAYTFTSLERRAEDAAKAAAEKSAGDALSEDVIRAYINKVAFGNIAKPDLSELEDGFDPSDKGDQ